MNIIKDGIEEYGVKLAKIIDVYIKVFSKRIIKYLLSGCFIYLFTIFCYGDFQTHTDTEKIKIQDNQFKQSIIWNMKRDRPRISLTFDDGPDQIVTPEILTILKRKKVKATFFVVGHMVLKYPSIVKRIVEDGHDIANHTWAHYRLDEMNQSQINFQILSTTNILKRLNIPMKPYMRPPGGRFNYMVVNAAKRQGLTIVMWDVNAADYMRKNNKTLTKYEIHKRVTSKVKSGSIILMHNSTITAKTLPLIIDSIRKMGYKFCLIN